MIEIGRFVFEKFLSPPERAEEGIRWLHFVRKDRRPSSPQDTKELKRIIEENKPESSVILYVNTIDFRDYVKATGEFPLDKGSLPKGTILSLKGGSEEEVLEYCKLISENASQRIIIGVVKEIEGKYFVLSRKDKKSIDSLMEELKDQTIEIRKSEELMR